MVLIVFGAFGLAVWISGVGPTPYVVIDAVIPVVVVPAVLVMIGISPSRFVSAFRSAIRPDGVPGDELAAARTIIAGFSRMVVASVALFISIGVIAMLHDLPPGDAGVVAALLAGSRTLLVDVLYALVLQALLIQPLLMRLDIASPTRSSEHFLG